MQLIEQSKDKADLSRAINDELADAGIGFVSVRHETINQRQLNMMYDIVKTWASGSTKMKDKFLRKAENIFSRAVTQLKVIEEYPHEKNYFCTTCIN